MSGILLYELYASSVIREMCFFFYVLAEAYDPLDPNGNITIKWDVMAWTSDGYTVSMPNAMFIPLNRVISW